MRVFLLFVLCALATHVFAATREHPGHAPATHWVAATTEAEARALAEQHGAQYVGPVAHLPGYYLVREVAAGRIANDHPVLTRLEPVERVHRGIEVAGARHARPASITTRDDERNPLYSDQWNLRMIRAEGAWAVTRGAGVVHVVDECAVLSHPELSNAAPELAWDAQTESARMACEPDETHGTSAASVAAGADNTACGIGVAPNARLAMTRLLGNYDMTDAHEAAALARLAGNATVMSCSWGPVDDGRHIVYPGPLAHAALLAQFRAGTLIAWAAGNGAQYSDSVSLDGYASFFGVIAVGAATAEGEPAYYSEPGPAVHISAPSSSETRGVVAAYGTRSCTNGFGGTSAAAPTVAGVLALMAAARPGLTFADALDVLARTALHPSGIDWIINGVDLKWHPQLGFGVVNAEAAVRAAAARTAHKTLAAFSVPLSPRSNTLGMTQSTTDAAATAQVDRSGDVAFVVVKLGLELGRCNMAGAIDEIALISPAGTRIPLLGSTRVTAHSPNLSFTVRGVLGEDARGAWRVMIPHNCHTSIAVANNERSRLDVYLME